MVHKVFTWRYGGGRVFLCGSFNGWTERIQMINVEGCATVFQRILDLQPGYYQYKYLVDDVWRVDEEQHCVQDGFGMINNVAYVEETEILCPSFSAQSLHQNQGTPSGGSLHKPVFQLPINEIDVLRYRLSLHLSSSTVYDLMPDSGKVFALDVGAAVKQAFHLMYEEGVAVLPLWDEQNTKIVGMLTASDFISILLQLDRNRAILTDEEIEEHTISAWKDIKFRHHREVSGTSQPLCRTALIQAGPDESLKDVALRILHNKISAVPILSSSEDGSCPNLLFIACLSGILKHICRHLRRHLEFLPLLQQPVGNLPLGTWAREIGKSGDRLLLTLRASEPLSSALNLLIQARVSSVPIVDDNGILVDVYCRSDITSLANSNGYTRIQLDQTIISQALEIADVTSQSRYQTCTRFDSLYRVMELLSDQAVRRVIVIEASSRQVEGIITLRDIFSYFLA
ncbi:sucrose nonfermenting 4-like protein isoform X2 [Coffea arabica]|uniref:Sucrose nonfermenting 4-like protein isoform X2 n=1 Tax=Coffea arabica TaxID=13443 RepID=A0A6P6X4U3_COFAR|nr:sucrose nonfermenting 4-like protein isoform X2 [Coffea arabica]